MERVVSNLLTNMTLASFTHSRVIYTFRLTRIPLDAIHYYLTLAILSLAGYPISAILRIALTLQAHKYSQVKLGSGYEGHD